MSSLILRLVPVVVVAAAMAIWLAMLRHNRQPAVRAICWSLGFLTAALRCSSAIRCWRLSSRCPPSRTI